MNYGTHVYCPTCFAIPGETCRTKYVVHGRGEVTAVLCPTHNARLADSERETMRHSLAQLVYAVASGALNNSGR
jgi:hypothetical protein